MADEILTRDDLIDTAPDNTLRLITPQVYRNFILSAFGATLPFAPTPQDDLDGTGGNGAFDTGSVWTNPQSGSKSYWICFDGSHNAADWAEIQLVRNLPVQPTYFDARITAGPFAATPLKISGIQATANSGDYQANLVNPTDALSLNPGMQCANSGIFLATTLLAEVNQLGGFVRMSTPAVATGSFTFDATPLAYDWEELSRDPVTGATFPKPGGQSGTATTAPALNLEPDAMTNLPNDVFMRAAGIASGLSIFEFTREQPPTGSYTAGSQGQTSPVDITYLGNVSNPTTITFGPNVFVTINPATWTLIVPWPVSQGGTGNTTFSPHQVIRSDGSGNLEGSGAMGDGQLIIGASGGTPSVGSLGSSDGSITITNTANHIDLKATGGGGGAGPYNVLTINVTFSHAITTFVGARWFVLQGIPANRVIRRISSRTTTTWVGLSQQNLYFAQTALPNNLVGGVSAFTTPAAGPYLASDSIQFAPTSPTYSDGTYSIAIAIGAGTPTAGASTIYLEYQDT